MRSSMLLIGALGVVSLCSAADPQPADAGKNAEKRSCLPCHSLRLIESQRLSVAAWTKEVDKMMGWGAVVPDRQVLIDYLTTEYSNSKPLPTPATTANSSGK